MAARTRGPGATGGRARSSSKTKAGIATTGARQYRAPALDRGLDILELLSRESRPMSLAMITQKLGKSAGQLFRMIQVLEYRGFIEQAENGSGYVATGKLFSLGMEQAPVKTLLELALPEMRQLSQDIGQSCHLAVRAGGDIVVVARMESDEQIGFTVRIGYRRPLIATASGAVLYAFQSEAVRQRWEAGFAGQAGAEPLAEFRSRAQRIAKQGYERRASPFVEGLMDLSAPILNGGSAVAALTVAFVRTIPLHRPMDDSIERLKAAAARISAQLVAGDGRV